jgi:hypothetical protein
MIRIIVEHKTDRTTFQKIRCVEEWIEGRDDKKCVEEFYGALADMRRTVKEYKRVQAEMKSPKKGRAKQIEETGIDT